MSRGNVFKLSGNLALGGATDTYSTNQLQSIKSSLRLLKARQSQKKSQQTIDIKNNYGASYSSNTAQRSELRTNDNKDYNYFQSNAKNHLPSYDDGYSMGYNQPVGKVNSRTSIYQNDKIIQGRDKNTNFSSMNRNYNQQKVPSRNNDYSYGYNDNYASKQQSARNPIKNRTQQPQSYNNNEDFSYKQPNKKQDDTKQKTQTRPPLRKQQLNQQASNYNQPVFNDHEDRSLKQVNRQNKAQIVQYDPSTFIQCSVGCGRKFNPQSIQKHEAICYKVFQKKRKEFNAQEQRVLDAEHKKIVKNVMVQQKRTQVNQSKKQSGKGSKNDQKMSKWKAQSLAFRAMLKNNRGDEVSAQQRQQVEQAKNLGMIKCPHCGRSFNETAGPKHITFCQNQSKKNKMKR